MSFQLGITIFQMFCMSLTMEWNLILSLIINIIVLFSPFNRKI